MNPQELLTAWTEFKAKLLTNFKKRGLTEKSLKLLELLADNLSYMALTSLSVPPPKDIMQKLRDKLPWIKQSCQNLREEYTSGLREDDIDDDSALEYVDQTYMNYIDLVETYLQIAEVNLPPDERLAQVRQLVANKQYEKLNSLYEQGGF